MTAPAGAATSTAAGKAGFVPAPAAGAQAKFLRGDGTWQTPTNTTYSNMTAATASAAGKAGLVPAPAKGAQAKFLRGDATWQVPTDTKNTTGTTNKTGTKMFLAAATSQATNPVTYSNSKCYIGTDNCLYSGGSKVSVNGHTHSYAGTFSIQELNIGNVNFASGRGTFHASYTSAGHKAAFMIGCNVADGYISISFPRNQYYNKSTGSGGGLMHYYNFFNSGNARAVSITVLFID